MQPLESKRINEPQVVVIQPELLKVPQMNEAPVRNVIHGVDGDGQVEGGRRQVFDDVTKDFLISMDALERLSFREPVFDAVVEAVAADEPRSTKKNRD